MPQLLLTCLGAFQVRLAGTSLITFQTDKMRALLVYLAVERQAHQRSALAQLLWPGYSEESARNSLRQALHQLRQLLHDAKAEPPLLLINRKTVQLNPAASLTVDVTSFAALLAECATHPHSALLTCEPCLVRLRQAVDLYQGDFLAGFTVADSNAFEEWRRALQERLHLQLLDVLTYLADAAEAAGDSEQALQDAQRQLALEPWLEAAHRRMMHIFARRGQRALALAQYQRCSQVLLEELGVEPEDATRVLYEAIRAGQIPRSGTMPPSKGEPMALVAPPTRPPLLSIVARPQELAQLENALTRSLRGQGQARFILGEAGSGKTTLVHAFVEQAQLVHPSLRVVYSAASEMTGSSDPFWLLRELLQQLIGLTGAVFSQPYPPPPLARQLLAKIITLLIEQAPALLARFVTASTLLAQAEAQADGAPDWLRTVRRQVAQRPTDDLSPQVSQEQIIHQATMLLQQLAQAYPLLLVFDDLHWADSSSLTLLRYLCQRLKTSRMLVIGLHRPEEVPGATDERSHLLRDLLNEGKRQFGDVVLDLDQVMTDAGHAFVAGWLDSEPTLPNAAFRQALLRHTEGHPLFTIELVRDLQERGILQRDAAGRWIEPETIDWQTLPARSEGVIAARLERLPPPLRAALAIASIEGAEFTAEVIVHVQSPAPDQLETVERELIHLLSHTLGRQYRLVEAQGFVWTGRRRLARYRFRHVLFQNYLYQQLEVTERADLHAQVGAALEHLYDEAHEQVAVALAYHYQAAGLLDKAIGYLLRAGEQARALSANEEAIRHFQQGLTLLGQMPNSIAQQRQELQFQLPLGNALIAQRGFAAPAAGTAFLRARTLCQQLQESAQLFAALHGLHHYHYVRGEWELARQLGEQMVTLAQERAEPELHTEAHRALGIVLWHLGEFAAAQAQFAQGIAAYALALHPTYLRRFGQDPGIVCLGYAACNDWLLGYPTQAQKQMAESLKLAAELQHPFSQARAINFAAMLQHFRRDLAGTLAQSAANSTLSTQQGFAYYQAWSLILHGWAVSVQGGEEGLIELQEGERIWVTTGSEMSRHFYQVLLAEALYQAGQSAAAQRQLDEARATIPGSGRFWEAEIYRWQGELALATNGGSAVAEAYFAQAITTAQQQQARLLELRATVSLCRLWQRQGKSTPAHQRLSQLYDWFSEGFETVDLQTAGALLQELRPQTAPGEIREEETRREESTKAAFLPPASLSRVALPPLQHDWGEMPAVDFFTGRVPEVAQLTAWLAPAATAAQPAAQLITVLGMGGIGKTTLAAVVTKAVAPTFSVVIWRSLHNAPLPAEILRDWLQRLAQQRLTVLPESLDEQVRLLLDYLRQTRCLLVLDNVESIFHDHEHQGHAGVARAGYEGYDTLLQRLAESEHQSCLLLTSREQPHVLLRAGRQAQSAAGRVRVLPLTGLDHQAGRALLQNNGLQSLSPVVDQLIDHYSGNPLALQIVAATIADFFGGDVAAFQQEEGMLFDGLRIVLDQQFARLTPLERDLLIWLAIEREAVTVQTLRSNFVQPVPTRDLLEALQALQERSLLEKHDNRLTLQNVIIEYTTDYLVEQVYREITELRVTNYELQEAVSDEEHITRNVREPLGRAPSFLNRFALLKAQAREEVRQSQARLILQPLANRLLAELSKAQVEERVMALVQGLRYTALVMPGYAGGNLLNLWVHIGSDLCGRDFSRIALWQVFLAGVYAQGLNLAGADLRGAVFTQRFSSLRSFGFDAQGELLLADISDGRLRLLRLHDGRLYREVALPALRILNTELSPGCNAMLMYLADYQLALLDLTTGQLFSPLVRHQHSVWRVCFSPDGRLIASGDSGGLVCIWERQTGQLVQERQITSDAVSALAIAPDGVTMASATVAGTVFLWSLADSTRLRRLQGHDEEVATLAFLDNGSLLASGSHDMTVGVWDVATGELRQRLRGHTRPIRKSAATATGPWLVTGGGDHFLYVWDWQYGAPLHLLADHAASIDRLVISADGQRAATLDLNAVVSLWDLRQGRRIDFYPIYHNAIMSIQFTPDGEALVAGGSDGVVYLWQMQEGGGARMTARLTAHKQRIFSVAVHPDGNLIASAGDGSVIVLWARSSGQLLHTLQGHTRNIAMVAMSPDGQWLASGNGDGTVTLWSLPAGRQRRQLQIHTNMVGCCAFSPNRKDACGRPQQLLASGSFDHTLAIWDVESGALLQHLHGHTNAIGRCLFSTDGRRLISISFDETVRIWDVESGQELAVWPQSGGGYMALALHPAGKILAVSCYDHTLRLLDLNSGRCLAQLAAHRQIVVALAFHPNGQWLASAGADETIMLWDLAGDALYTGQIVCRHTLQAPAPYAGMQIAGVTGISEAQKAALVALGAVEE